MKKIRFHRQTFIIFQHGWKSEIAELQRWFSSFLFALTILFLFAFAIGEIPVVVKQQMILSQVFLCCFLVLQLVHQRILSTEEEDRAIDVLVTYPSSYSSFYLAKVLLSVTLCSLVLLPFLGAMQLLHEVPVMDLTFLGITGLVIVALSALGVLLSQMTQKAKGRELVFPLLYFPLTIPVLLAAVQGVACYWGLQRPEAFNLWFGLLVGFCIIYLTLGLLLFEDIVGLD